jgi:cardiolipin synthase A/B
MEAHTGSPVVGGNAVELLLNGDQIFPAKLAAIRSARRSITYAEYFYAEGENGREIAEALANQCRAGVKANILLDGFGTGGRSAREGLRRGPGAREAGNV